MFFSVWLCWTPDGFSPTNFLILSLFYCCFLVLKCLYTFKTTAFTHHSEGAKFLCERRGQSSAHLYSLPGPSFAHSDGMPTRLFSPQAKHILSLYWAMPRQLIAFLLLGLRGCGEAVQLV